MPTVPMNYPASLPCPQTLGSQSAERRVASPSGGVFQTRVGQSDRDDFETVVFPPFNATQAAAFDSWWRDALLLGARWFAASWPAPQGRVPLVRRFVEPPTFQFSDGLWRVSAQFEVRGVSDSPIAYLSDCPQALALAFATLTEPAKAMLWRSADPSAGTIAANQPILNNYVALGRDPGAAAGAYFPISFGLSWSSLIDPSVGVSLFGGTRTGAGFPANSTSLELSIGSVPNTYPAPLCRACVFVSSGDWLGAAGASEGVACPITSPQATGVVYPKWFPDGVGGGGYTVASFLIRNYRGSLSLIDVAHA